MSNIPSLPPQYKTLNHCLKIAAEHDVRDPVVAYWCRFYAVQQGLSIDKSSAEAKKFLLALMDWLENRKKELRDNEAITNEAVAEAHIENYALRIFNWADGQDRAGIFNKNVVKTFYTSGILIDVLTNFNKGDLSEDFQNTRKYAKWKAAYINNCLKNGETPQPGPMGGDDEVEDEEGNNAPPPQASPRAPNSGPSEPWPSASGHVFAPQLPSATNPTPSASSQFGGHQFMSDAVEVQPGKGPVPLSLSEKNKAEKYCKIAGSALTFDDVPTAIINLEKALRLLTTGRDE